MSPQQFVSALNKESVSAITRLMQLIGFPVLTIIGTIFINQANTIIENQDKFTAASADHERRIVTNTIRINKLVRADQLFDIKQGAMQEALKNNSEIGTEYKIDYLDKYNEQVRENNFLNLLP